MNSLAGARDAGSAALRVALLAAMLMFAAGASQAAPGGGRGAGGGGRAYSAGGGRSYSGGGGRTYGGGSPTYLGGGSGSYGRGGRAYGGGGGRTYGGGGRTYLGGGGRYFGAGRYYHGGGRYYGPYGYRYIHPRTFVSFGIGLGFPYYYPPDYGYYVKPYSVEVQSGTSIDVSNEPPAGCYYYDRFCDRQFSNLDEYTHHLESQDHPKTIEVVQKDSGDTLRTLEFVDGYWSVKK